MQISFGFQLNNLLDHRLPRMVRRSQSRQPERKTPVITRFQKGVTSGAHHTPNPRRSFSRPRSRLIIHQSHHELTYRRSRGAATTSAGSRRLNNNGGNPRQPMMSELHEDGIRRATLHRQNSILQLKNNLKSASYNAGTQGASRYFAECIPGPGINTNPPPPSTNSNQNNAYYAAIYIKRNVSAK